MRKLRPDRPRGQVAATIPGHFAELYVRHRYCGASARGTHMAPARAGHSVVDRKSTRLNSSHANISYAVFCLKKKKNRNESEKHESHMRTYRQRVHCAP